MSDQDLEVCKQAAIDWANQQKTEYFKNVWLEVADEIQDVITERKSIRDLYG